MGDELNLMVGRDSWIPLELFTSLHIFREADAKMCHGDVTRLLGLARGRQVRSTTTGLAAPQGKSGRRLGEGQGHLSDDIPGPLRFPGLLLQSSLKPGFHPAPFVWFGNEDLKATPKARSPVLMYRKHSLDSWTLAPSSCFCPNSRKHLIYP